MNAKKVLKNVFSCLALFFVTAGVNALEVNRNELQSAGAADTIVFRNYSGPHSVINTIEQIRQIGSGLGESVKGNTQKAGTFGSSNRYQVIHAVDPSVKEKMDADIIIIGKDATVDHITNLRRIISAYLSAAYGYSNKDADTIATFVTVYNAVYRGNLDYFKPKYKDVVINNLSSSIVGLSTNYQDWPGKTQIIIPLYDLNGGLSTVDTSLISDKEVVKSMQGEEDKGIDARKDMVDIKEREADNAQEKADDAQAKADAEKAKLAEEQKKQAEADKKAAEAKAAAEKAKADAEKAKADAEKAKADAAAAQKAADDAKKNAKQNPNDAEAQKNAADAQKEADQAKKDAASAQNEATSAQKEADSAQKEAASAQKEADSQAQKTEAQAESASQAQTSADNAQNAADQKRNEAQEERTSIAKDQQELIAESSKNQDENVMYGLKNIDDAGVASGLVKMNTQDGTVIKESPVTVIRGRTAYEDGENFIAIAGTNFGNGAVRLVQIDKKNLEIAAESKEILAETSVLIEKDGSYYCVIKEGSNHYIGKYNGNVENLLRSTVTVNAATPITITSKGILVNDSNDTPIILNPKDLSSISPASSSNGQNIIQKTVNSASNLYNSAK
ncbi:P83/100 family protein [Treponema sp. UBA3813]|uniref:P83/100 family protein n=1 Tax=Treponema sp. UBA3813 TaxID=1947715 RepID=UPI0025D827BB|nr:P83/100 family protein [Treponema sp. UBA3813]